VDKTHSFVRRTEAILKHLPNEYHALFEIAYITGWRMKSELLTRQWRHSDFGAGTGCGSMPVRRRTRLPAASSGSPPGCASPRAPAPVHLEDREESRSVIPWVFCRADGVRVHTF
jgi:hypothetical protein